MSSQIACLPVLFGSTYPRATGDANMQPGSEGECQESVGDKHLEAASPWHGTHSVLAELHAMGKLCNLFKLEFFSRL